MNRIKKHGYLKSLLGTCLLPLTAGWTTSATAVEVIHAYFTSQGSTQRVDIRLFEQATPVTVNNFLANIDAGAYDKTFINRSISGFVLQSGGYSFDPALGAFSYDGNGSFNGGLQAASVTTIQNEPGISNLRGTIAMAKSGSNSDSDSHEWFINLSDNIFLDNDARGGFTVFGEILPDGMLTIDNIAAIDTFDLTADIAIPSAFSKVPLTGFNNSMKTSEIGTANLVMLKLERAFGFNDVIDFGEAIANISVQRTLTVTNSGSQNITIGNFDTSQLSSAYTTGSDTCTVSTLSAASSCTIDLIFTPSTAGYYLETARLEINGRNFDVRLKTPAPDIDLSTSSIDFGFQPVYKEEDGLPEQSVIYIYNNGELDLRFSSISFISSEPDDFEFIDNCTVIGNSPTPGIVPPGRFCLLVLNFKPRDLAIKTASISILSDDPDESRLVIDITGGSNNDNDGIAGATENASPNNGDGNNDGSPDRLQDNVVSFPGEDGEYITLVSDKETRFSKVSLIDKGTLMASPADARMDTGIMTFEMTVPVPGGTGEFGIILPASKPQSGVFIYDETGTNGTFWHQLEKSSSPGVVIIGNSHIRNVNGSSIYRNISRVQLIDGGFGDADNLANGKILFIGAPDINGNSDSSSGGSLLWLLLITAVPYSLRKVQPVTQRYSVFSSDHKA